jgi:hypothetical protein
MYVKAKDGGDGAAAAELDLAAEAFETFVRKARSENGHADASTERNAYLVARMAVQDAAVHRASRGPSALRERVATLEEALRDLLVSADCTWESHNGGHDWREACDRARSALALYRSGGGDAREAGRREGLEQAARALRHDPSVLPDEIRAILRDVAHDVHGADLSGRAAAAIVSRDLCPRCAGTGCDTPPPRAPSPDAGEHEGPSGEETV